MDIATIIGMLGSIGFLVLAMFLSGGGSLGMFADAMSVYIVFGGSIFVVISKFTLSQFFGAGKAAAKVFFFKAESPEELIEKAVQLADAARKGGFLALEEAEVPNAFMQKGINMLVDGHDADVVRNALLKDISQTERRHEIAQNVFRSMAEAAPAMGIMGTIIGLVAMLSNMEDPKSIGPAMAIALLTTLYGAFLANVVCIPIADKLAIRTQQEKMNNQLIVDAIMGIQDGQNPKVIEGLLRNYLAQGKRDPAGE